MIVVVVIGVLAAIALPSYQDYASRARRADAKTGLMEVQMALEKWRANNPSYTTDMTNLGYDNAANNASKDGYYNLSVTAAAASSYTMTATINAATAQNGDDCGTFTITMDNTGENYTASGDDSTCWNK
jgi:type IV pilus assembly protein PilE